MRNGWRSTLCVLAVGVAVAGCGGGSSSTPAPGATNKAGEAPVTATAPAAAPRPTVSVMPRTPDPGPPLPPIPYESKGRRDPFTPIQVAKEKTGLDIGSVKLVGVVSASEPMALVESPDGLGYIMKRGDVLGNGRVSSVTMDAITFVIAPRAGQAETAVTLRLAKD